MLKNIDHTLEFIFNGNLEYFNAPEDQVEDGEIVLGILENEKARAIFSAWVDLGRATNNYIQNIDLNNFNENSEEEKIKILSIIRRFRGQVDILKAIFWQIIHDEFPRTLNPNLVVGIREKWQVVIFKNQNTNINIIDFLRMLSD